MDIKTIKKTLLIFTALIFSSPLIAGELEDAIKAYGEKDYKTAYIKLRPLANEGSADAQVRLGQMYYFGDGVKKNEKKAFEWHQKAAKQNGIENSNTEFHNKLGSSCYSGVMNYFENYYSESTYSFCGKKVKKDEKTTEWLQKMLSWMKTAAEKGNAEAQNNLGIIHYRGWGVERSREEALKWFEKAVAQNHILAVYNSAVLYSVFARRKTDQYDLEKAARLQKIAAKQGYAPSQFQLFLLLCTMAYDFPTDDYLYYPNDPKVIEGLMWLVVSGDKDSLNGVNERLSLLSYSEELAEKINRLANECIAKNFKNCYNNE